MDARRTLPLLLCLLCLLACNKSKEDVPQGAENAQAEAYQKTQTVSYNSVSVDVVIDKPRGTAFDVLMVFHGTVGYDSLILEAAHRTLNRFQELLEDKNMLLVSVAYPEENLLFGDNIRHCEAALLWLKNKAANELGIEIGKVFLAGHSQGGYLVTRLNTMHPTDGVVANAPGPLNLVYRCQLEEDGTIAPGLVCTLLHNYYGSTTNDENAYMQRSLLSYTTGYLADILFVQGMKDSPIQMHSWPTFKENVAACTNCLGIDFMEIPALGHPALFHNPQAIATFNAFLQDRRD